MKKLLTAAVTLAVFTAMSPAGAAPRSVPLWSWTGFYVGGNLGYSWGNDSGPITLSDSVLGPLSSVSGNTALDGIIGGGQTGYNWQIANWVYGLEADIQASGQRGNAITGCPGGTGTGTSLTLATLNGPCSLGHLGDSASFSVAGFPVSDTLSEKLDWFGTFRVRVGPTITPTILTYITGGLAYGQISVSNAVSGANVTGLQGTNTFTVVPGAGGGISNSTIKLGWTIGGGIEGVLWGNWTGKIEYLFVDLGTVSGTFNTTIATPAGNTLIGSYSSHVTDNILRVGISYNFR